jgi:DNA-binding CsgD family transcriptional regulator
MSIVEDLHRAREAYERREWITAYRALSDLDEADLKADDFAALATTAYLLGRRNDCVQALQRAYKAYLDGDDPCGAARAAYWLTTTLWEGGELAIGNGWLARAQRLLDEYGEDVVERGYLIERVTMGHIMRGEFADALASAPGVTQYGRRFGDADLTALGQHMAGRLKIFAGQVADGLRLMDEAMVAVLAGDVSPIISGVVYCSSIEACQELSDFGRASEWTHALTTWCDGQPGLVAFTGQCAVHRGQLMRLHGAYADAVTELERAADRYAAAGGSRAVGLAHYERGEVHRLRGEYDAAQDAFASAAEFGHPAQPGGVLLWLARGQHEAAGGAIRRLLGEQSDPVHRSQLLPAAVDVVVALGDVDTATALAEELSGIANAFGCAALRAAASYSAASVAVETGDPNSGLSLARMAAMGWGELAAPYEAGRSRVVVGRALRLLGDEESAVVELAAARATLTDLGAHPAADYAASLLARHAAPGGLSPREVEVLRLVAAGKSNAEIAVTLVLSEKTVARHLSNIFTKLDVGSRTAAAAFAYEHNLV